MPSIGPSFFILGLVVASVTAEETTLRGIYTTLTEFKNITITVTPSIITNTSTSTTRTTNTTSISITISTMNITNSTTTPSTTKQNGNESSRDDKASQTTPKMSLITPKPIGTTTKSTPESKDNSKDKGPSARPRLESDDSTGIIILVVIIIVALGFGVACYFARRRGRRYSVDFNARPDEANIPLSTVEPELPIDAVPQNGLQTFESTETAAKEPQEPEAKPEVEEQQKAEADKPVVDPSAESAAPPPSPDSTEDKPKEEVVEQSPPAPVELSVDEKTDDEGVDSNKTSVESLKETNENNSNNADLSQQRDLKSSSLFWDVPLDSPV